MDIRTFFKRRKLNAIESSDSPLSANEEDVVSDRGNCSNETGTDLSPTPPTESEAKIDPGCETEQLAATVKSSDLVNSHPTDLGTCMDSKVLVKLSDSSKYHLLTNPPNPSRSYDFKADVSVAQRSFRYAWLEQYSPWLAYSEKLKGALCLHCVLFPSKVHRGFQGSFIVRAFTKYKDFHECAKNHMKSQWHREAVQASKNFVDIFSNKRKGIEVQLNDAVCHVIEQNRKKIFPIISTIVYCATHDIPLRGKTDDSGNFKDLLLLRVESGDTLLEEHFRTCSGKTKYTSHRIQNELISVCGSIIRKEIVNAVNASIGFSLLADETADIAGIEQLSIGVRFTDSSFTVREEFLGFVPLEKLDARSIATTMLTSLETYGLDLMKLVGLGFDGCSTMAGKEGGVQKLIRAKYPKASFFHCASHRLNLVINDLNSVRAVQNTVGTVKEVINFFRESTLRRKLVPNIPLLCQTRWSSKYKSLRIFYEHFIEIKNTVDQLSDSSDVNQATRARAYQLSCSMSTSDFIVCLTVIAKYSAQLEPVCNNLQSVSMDLYCVRNHVEILLNNFRSHRKDAECAFSELFNEATAVAKHFDLELKVTRHASRQTHRENYPASCVEDYFRRSIFIPYLDSIISSLETRFSQENETACCLFILHPLNMKNYDAAQFRKNMKDVAILYNIDNFYEEALSWREYWAGLEEKIFRDLSLADLQMHCQFYPAVSQALKILLSLPPTTCTIERSFSTLRRVKTWLRSTICEERLNGLCLLSVHRAMILSKKEIFIHEVIDEFGRQSRKLQFLFSE